MIEVSGVYSVMEDSILTRDVAVIGAGPVGLFAVFQCGMLGLTCHVVDALPEIGGQCTALYPEKPIYDIPAYPSVLAGELIERLKAQAAPFTPAYHLGERVDSLAATNGAAGEAGWDLTTQGGTALRCRAILIAAGPGAFGPNKPPLEGIERFEGKGIRYMVGRRADLAGQDIVIAGGGDSAVDWALSLIEVSKSVTVVHRRDKFRAAPDSLRLLHEAADAGRLTLKTPYQLSGLEGGERLTGVQITDADGQSETLPADTLLPFFGLNAALGPIHEWGLRLDRETIPVDQGTCETSVPGIYAAGDVAAYPHKLKLILTGFAEAASAAHAIRRRLHPDTPLHMEYSTTRGVPGR